MIWSACYTEVGGEIEARNNIEALGRGTLLPTFCKVYYLGGRRKAYERPIISRYILVALEGMDDKAWSIINHLKGVQNVLSNGGKPSPVSDEEVARLTIMHATGSENEIQRRAANGRFEATKRRRRRARPRAGKTARSNTYIIGANRNGISRAS